MKTLLAVFLLMAGSVMAGPVTMIDISDASSPKDFEKIKSDFDSESKAAWQKHVDNSQKDTTTHTIVTERNGFGVYTSDNGTSGTYTIIGH